MRPMMVMVMMIDVDDEITVNLAISILHKTNFLSLFFRIFPLSYPSYMEWIYYTLLFTNLYPPPFKFFCQIGSQS